MVVRISNHQTLKYIYSILSMDIEPLVTIELLFIILEIFGGFQNQMCILTGVFIIFLFINSFIFGNLCLPNDARVKESLNTVYAV